MGSPNDIPLFMLKLQLTEVFFIVAKKGGAAELLRNSRHVLTA